MATIYKTNGTIETIEPKNGKDFKLKELQKIVDGYIEIINIDRDTILVVNEEGLLKGLERNDRISGILGFDLVGPVLVCKSNQVK